MKEKLTLSDLQEESKKFSEKISKEKIKELYGVTDGKAVGTYIEHRFRDYLEERYEYGRGNSFGVITDTFLYLLVVLFLHFILLA